MVSRGASGSRSSLERKRRKIAEIDRKLIRLMSQRVRLVQEIWLLKVRAELPFHDPEQEAKVLTRSRRWSRSEGLRPEFGVSVMSRLLQEGKTRAGRTLTKRTKGARRKR
jgi:chorismate mutase/prephenate dehydrogenase